MPQISIIVPVYKVEKYLDRCVNSILNQTFTDFELILVDDGSPDLCPKMCDEWAKKDKRIKVIHKENGGAGAARNVALRQVKGDYIGFVDSDDWIAPNMYEYLYSLFQQYPDVQIVQCDAIQTSSENQIVKQQDQMISVWNRKQMLDYFFRIHGEKSNYSIWNKLIKREVLKNFSFIEGTISEDVAANFDFFMNASKMVTSNKILYFYFVNQSGVTKSKVSSKDLEYIDVWKRIAQKVPDEYKKYADINLARANFTILSKMLLSGYNKNDDVVLSRKKQMKQQLRKDFKKLICWKMPVSRKILLLFILIFKF